MSILPKAIYRFNPNPIKILIAVLTEIEKKTVLKYVWNNKRAQVAKAIMRKNKSGWSHHTDFKTYYKAVVIQTVWCWHKKDTHRSMEQNREPRNKPTHIWPTNI